MSNTKRSARMVSAALALTLAGTATTATASATTPRSSTASQCYSETYVPVGSYHTFRTYFFGKTIVRIRDAVSTFPAYVQWYSGPTVGEVDIAQGGTSDLTRSFVGFNITLHPWYSSGVYVSFPIGPC